MSAKTLEVVVLLDRSGSMQSMKDDHEGGMRSFVEEQKKLGGDVRFTLIQFDDENPCEVVSSPCVRRARNSCCRRRQ